jgi:uncharacterized protein YjiS (DUF1127 family)
MASLAHPLSTNCQASSYALRSPARPRPGIIARSVALLELWAERMRERTQLARLSDRDLHDIGLSRCDVDHLLAKPFWRA